MKTFDVVPLVGIGTVLLGTTRSAVHGAMGKPESSFRKTEWSRHVTDTWFGSGFQVFYGGEEPTVNFIELCRGSEFKVLLFGEEVFSKDVPEIVRHVEKFAASDPNNPEHGSSFIFPSIELSLWQAYEGEIGENFFSTVGIGSRGYYSQQGV